MTIGPCCPTPGYAITTVTSHNASQIIHRVRMFVETRERFAEIMLFTRLFSTRTQRAAPEHLSPIIVLRNLGYTLLGRPSEAAPLV